MSGPNVWGPHGWKFIHYITLGYPPNPTNEIKEQYRKFFMSLKEVLPCSICGHHFKIHLIQFPLTDEILSNKEEFINWGILMHNLVNLSNNKKKYSNEEGLADIITKYKGDCPGYTDISLGNEKEKEDKYEKEKEDKYEEEKEDKYEKDKKEKEDKKSNYNKHKIYNIILIIIILLLLLLLYKSYK